MAALPSTSSDSTAQLSLPPDPVVHISLPVSTKLDRDNFLTWKSQIESIILGYGLSDHINEAFLPPPQTLTDAGVTRLNPHFLSWTKQDQLLLGWICSTISSSVLSQYISSKTVAHLWSALHRVYSAVSAARVMDLHRSLQSSTRGHRSCSDYFTHLLSIADQLAAAGSPIPDSDLVNYILTGLGPEFNAFVVTLTTRSTPVSLTELHGFLLHGRVPFLVADRVRVILDPLTTPLLHYFPLPPLVQAVEAQFVLKATPEAAQFSIFSRILPTEATPLLIKHLLIAPLVKFASNVAIMLLNAVIGSTIPIPLKLHLNCMLWSILPLPHLMRIGFLIRGPPIMSPPT